MNSQWHYNPKYDGQCLMPTILVYTDLDSDLFKLRMGRPNPGWTSNTFGYQGSEWAWQFGDTKEAVKAAIVRSKVIFAVSSIESYYKFLAFVAEKLVEPAQVGS